MKKKRLFSFRTVCILLILLIILVCVIVALNTGYVKNRIYSGDRITGSFTMIVDGKEYDPFDEVLEYENEGTHRLASSGSDFSIKGGEYGAYNISFVIENDKIYELTGDSVFRTYESDPWLTFQYINTNWWHITEMVLTAEMVFIDNEWVINTKVVYSETLESGGVSEYTVEKSFCYSDMISGNPVIQFGV